VGGGIERAPGPRRIAVGSDREHVAKLAVRIIDDLGELLPCIVEGGAIAGAREHALELEPRPLVTRRDAQQLLQRIARLRNATGMTAHVRALEQALDAIVVDERACELGVDLLLDLGPRGPLVQHAAQRPCGGRERRIGGERAPIR
jgi:hypothetical protein